MILINILLLLLFLVEKPMLIFANKHYIKQIDLRGMETEMLVHNLTNAVAVDYDYSDHCFYWSDITNQGSTIKRKCKDKSPEVVYFFHSNEQLICKSSKFFMVYLAITWSSSL